MSDGVDMVNHPPHYNQGGIECIDAIAAALGPEGYQAYLRGTTIKYLWRCELKGNPLQDLQKAAWYLARLTRCVEERKKTEEKQA